MTHGIHVFLRDRRDEILRTWETLVLAELRSVELVGVALRDSLPSVLDELADWLESGEPTGSAKVAAEGLKHVIQRLDEGLGLGQMMREYRLLREAILKIVLESEQREQERAGSSSSSRASSASRSGPDRQADLRARREWSSWRD